jgi:HlyD family secretion protein
MASPPSSSNQSPAPIAPPSLRIVHPDEFLPPIGNWNILGGIALLATFGSTVFLSAIFKYNVTVKAPAIIRPTGDLQVMQAAIGGTVKQLSVEVNQRVQQGDIIATLDDSQLQTQKRQIQIAIAQLQTQLKQIDQQLLAIDNQITAQRLRLDSIVAGAKADLQLAQRDYQNQQLVTQADVKEAQAAVDFAQEELNRFRQLTESGAVAELQIKEKEAALNTAQARLERTQALLNPSSATIKQAKEAVQQAMANQNATLAQLSQNQRQIQQQQAELQDKLLSNQQQLQQIETDLEQTIIRAPKDGIVQTLELRNLEQVVQPGDIVGYISPTQTPLVIKALVNHTDISQVETQQKVEIRIESCPYPDYGTVKGKVTEIAPDAKLQNPSQNSELQPSTTSSSVYEVIIQPQQLILENVSKTCTLQAGMQGRADIVTQRETILSFFLRKMRLLVNL